MRPISYSKEKQFIRPFPLLFTLVNTLCLLPKKSGKFATCRKKLNYGLVASTFTPQWFAAIVGLWEETLDISGSKSTFLSQLLATKGNYKDL